VKSAWLSAVVLGAAVLWACEFPAFEGSDICSGLRVGDVFEISIGPAIDKPGVSVECAADLGFGEGGRVKGSVTEVGPDGCGSAVGPIISLDGLFTACPATCGVVHQVTVARAK
jgi:hypothetical protein